MTTSPICSSSAGVGLTTTTVPGGRLGSIEPVSTVIGVEPVSFGTMINAAAAIVVLLVMMLALNALAIVVRDRMQQKLGRPS